MMAAGGAGLGAACALSAFVARSSLELRLPNPPTFARRGRVCKSIRAVTSNAAEAVEYELGSRKRARWAGDDPLARFVSSLIAIEPLYNVMKVFAKLRMIRTAEKGGIPWKQIVEELRLSKVYDEKELLENTTLSYPDYYIKPFHAYEDGNLSWKAAFEVEPAAKAVWQMTFPSYSAQKAAETLRGSWLHEIESHHIKFSNGLVAKSILDLGCATGDSTRYLRNHFPASEVTGLDLSPYFLSVAQYMEKQITGNTRPIKYIHAIAEDTGLPSESFDIVSIAFVLHELPQTASVNFLIEARRLLKPGGTLAITDQSPKAKVIQDLPPALFVLLKSTEPWLDEFHRMDLEGEVEKQGFTNVKYVLTTHRHFTLTATAI